MDNCKICNKVGGPSVKCTTCDKYKNPVGRSAPMEVVGGYCNSGDCNGYYEDPQPSELWPNERYGDSLGHMDWHDKYNE